MVRPRSSRRFRLRRVGVHGGGAGAAAGSGCGGAVTRRETDAPGRERGPLRAVRRPRAGTRGLAGLIPPRTAEAGAPCLGAGRLSLMPGGPAGQGLGGPRERSVRGVGLGDGPHLVCRRRYERARTLGSLLPVQRSERLKTRASSEEPQLRRLYETWGGGTT